MTPIEFIALHGIVMQSAQHAHFPSLVDFLAGEPIRGSWWGHPKGREIFHALGVVYESLDVVATRLVDGKLTLLHRRVWPLLATLAYNHRITVSRLARVTQEHTDSGRHEAREVPFPDWLPRGLELPSYEEALAMLTAAAAAAILEAAPKQPSRGRRR
jgi:hypothetical protein